MRYSEDHKNIIFTNIRREEVSLSVSMIDSFRESSVSLYDFEKLLEFRSLSHENIIDGKATPPKSYYVNELLKADLTHCYIEYFFANWEDSETISTNRAVALVQDGGNYFKLKFDETYEKNEQELDAYYDTWDEVTESFSGVEPEFAEERLSSFSFSSSDSFIVIWPDGIEKLD